MTDAGSVGGVERSSRSRYRVRRFSVNLSSVKPPARHDGTKGRRKGGGRGEGGGGSLVSVRGCRGRGRWKERQTFGVGGGVWGSGRGGAPHHTGQHLPTSVLLQGDSPIPRLPSFETPTDTSQSENVPAAA